MKNSQFHDDYLSHVWTRKEIVERVKGSADLPIVKPRIRICFERPHKGNRIFYWFVPINLDDGPVAIYYPDSRNYYWGRWGRLIG
jgi:hypothetical protein